MIRNLWRTLAAIRNADRIPKLPRGMLATHYEHLTRQDREVLARLGARDPIGIKVAMKRYKVTSVEELLKLLEHQQPRRKIFYRIRQAVGRLLGGYANDPHREAILRDERARRAAKNIELEQRVKSVSDTFKGD